MVGKRTTCSSYLRRARAMNEGDGEMATSGQKLRSMTGAQTRAVLGKGDLAHGVQAVFDTPMAAALGQQGLWPIRAGWEDDDEGDDFEGGLVLFGARAG